MRIKMTIGLAVALLIIIFTMQNVDVVRLRFLFWELAVSQALLIFVVFSAGLFGGYLLGSLAGMSRRKQSKDDTKRVNP
ncbi:MAG TPA: LapA family protein [Geopsychrobacteraceae bacterium]|jgi:uncharacterized integral membrane protein